MEKLKKNDETFMRRALQLARLGAGNVSPNPMVGAVIVSADGKIIGEGYHRKYGEGHAEVNAIASVKETDRHLLKESTIYVTLEPCSHYGKTPPCAKLIVETGFKRVVVGALDPFIKVSGRGMKLISDAGIDTTTGVLATECEYLNRRFMTAHRAHRPWILLKWAESSDGYMGTTTADGRKAPVKLSGPISAMWMHRQRSLSDAVMVGSGTVLADNPQLSCRLWPGHNPKRVTFRASQIPEQSFLAKDPDTIYLEPHAPLLPQMHRLYEEYGITSLMVEGGAGTIRSFLKEGLADEIREEISPLILGSRGATLSPLSISELKGQTKK